MEHTFISVLAIGSAVLCCEIPLAAQNKVKPAKDFFPGLSDVRKVVYIETADDEVLTFDEGDNASYILNGRALEIRAAKIKVHGSVLVRSFAESTHGTDTAGAAAKGPDGPPGTQRKGDGAGGGRGGADNVA
jgi:hypothetical protein